jgi:hypothetical protein
MLRRCVVAVALLVPAVAEDKTPTPKIDYKLQFELRTLEMQMQSLEIRARELKARLDEKAAAAQAFCGAGYSLSLDQQSLEYVCVAAPAKDEKKK